MKRLKKLTQKINIDDAIDGILIVIAVIALLCFVDYIV